MPDLIPVRQFMTPRPETIEDTMTLSDAKDRLFDMGVHHLPVVHDGKLVGVLSHRDIAVAESLTTAALTSISVASVMIPQPFTCGPNAHVEAVAREMASHHYGSAIVVDPVHPLQVLGVFTTTDALRALAAIIDQRG